MADSIYFNNNHQCGYGTWPLTGEECTEAVTTAAEIGYRAFDTAQMYNNEAATGEALKSTAIKRGDLFITTKVNHSNYDQSSFLPSVEKSLRALQTDYVDVLLLHWPPPDFNIAPALELLAQAHANGFTRHIGVSNFTAKMMRESISILDIPIVVNQVEFHPLLNQDILLQASIETGIPLAAYCAVARGEIFNYPVLAEIGKSYERSAAQVAQRWILHKGVSVNTMSTNPANIKANLEITDFKLNDTDIKTIDQLTSHNFRIVNKSLVPWAPDFD